MNKIKTLIALLLVLAFSVSNFHSIFVFATDVLETAPAHPSSDLAEATAEELCSEIDTAAEEATEAQTAVAAGDGEEAPQPTEAERGVRSSVSGLPTQEERPALEQAVIVDGVEIRLTAEAGVFPTGARFSAARVSVSETRKVEDAIEEIRDEKKNVAISYTYDICVVDEAGRELQPADNSKVKVSFCARELSNENLNTAVYHVDDTLVAQELPIIESGEEEIAVETDGFSYYTVEFTYEEKEYVLQGGREIKLSELLEAIGLSGEAEVWEVSAPELFNIYLGDDNGVIYSYEVIDGSDAIEIPTNDGDTPWLLSLQPFDTTQWLGVTIDGIEYEIVVTDDDLTNTVPASGFYSSTISTRLDGSPQVTNDSFVTGSQSPTNVRQSQSTTNATDFASGLPLSTIYIDQSKIKDQTGTLTVLDGPYKDYIVQIENGLVCYDADADGAPKLYPSTVNELTGDLYYVIFPDAAILPDNSTADLKITFSNARIVIDQRYDYKNAGEGISPYSYSGDVFLSRGASFSYGGTDATDMTSIDHATQREALVAAVAGSAGFQSNNSKNPSVGKTMDAKYQIVNKSGNPVDGTFIYAICGINLDRDPYMTGGNNVCKPLWYANAFTGGEEFHYFSESMSVNSGMASDYIYVRSNLNDLDDTNTVDDSDTNRKKSHFWPQIIQDSSGHTRFIANSQASGVQAADDMYASGFVTLANANAGLTVTATGHGSAARMYTNSFSSKTIWYRYISQSGLHGNIQTTSEGNFGGSLNDTSDSGAASHKLDPGTYVVAEGKTITYSLMPEEKYQIAKLRIKNAGGSLQEIKYNGKPLHTMQAGDTVRFSDAAGKTCTLTALTDGKFTMELPSAEHNEEVYVEWQRISGRLTVQKQTVDDVEGIFPFQIKARKTEEEDVYDPLPLGSIWYGSEDGAYHTEFTGASFSGDVAVLAAALSDVQLTERIEISGGQYLWKTDKNASELGISCAEGDCCLYVDFLNAPSAVLYQTLDDVLNQDHEVISFYDPNITTQTTTSYWNFATEAAQTTEPGWYSFTLTKDDVPAHGQRQFEFPQGYAYDVEEIPQSCWRLVSVNGDPAKTSGAGLITPENSLATEIFRNEQLYSLSIEKEVEGSLASRDKYFRFTADFSNLDPSLWEYGGELYGSRAEAEAAAADAGESPSDVRERVISYSVLIAEDGDASSPDGCADALPEENTATIYSGMTNPTSLTADSAGNASVTFYLQHGQRIVVCGLPRGTSYTVKDYFEDYRPELALTGDTLTGEGTAAQASIPQGPAVLQNGEAVASDTHLTDHTTLHFKNIRDGVVPTGVANRSSGPAVTMTLLAAALFLLGSIGRRRPEDE